MYPNGCCRTTGSRSTRPDADCLGQLVDHVSRLGVEPITGKPYKPTTQGKNERFHQTLFRYLDKQPLAANLDELQTQVDAFDQIYNTQRPHQGLPGRITPQAAWDADSRRPPGPHARKGPRRADATRRAPHHCEGARSPPTCPQTPH